MREANEGYIHQVFDQEGNVHEVQCSFIEDSNIVRSIARNTADATRVVAATGRLGEAICLLIEQADDKAKTTEEIMAGLVMSEVVEQSQRLVRTRKFIGKVTGRRPLLYRCTR